MYCGCIVDQEQCCCRRSLCSLCHSAAVTELMEGLGSLLVLWPVERQTGSYVGTAPAPGLNQHSFVLVETGVVDYSGYK